MNEPGLGNGLASRISLLERRHGGDTLTDGERALGPREEPTPAQSNGLALTHLSKRWRSKPPNWVLRDVDLHLSAGSIAWIGGVNGAGKTTLLRVVSGVMSPDGGSVRYCGLDPERERRAFQRRTGFVSAGDRGLYARLSVRRHLEFWARIAFVPRQDQRACCNRVVQDFGLAELLDRRVERLSLGQRQRVRLALAFLHDPELALLDEPASSLDEEGLALLRAAVGRIIERGGVVVWCSPPGERATIDSHFEMILRGGSLCEA